MLKTWETSRLRQIKDQSEPTPSQVTKSTVSFSSLCSISFISTLSCQCSLLAPFVRSFDFSNCYDWFWSYFQFYQCNLCYIYVNSNSASFASPISFPYWWYSNLIWRYHSHYLSSSDGCLWQSFWKDSLRHRFARFGCCYLGPPLAKETQSYNHLVTKRNT